MRNSLITSTMDSTKIQWTSMVSWWSGLSKWSIIIRICSTSTVLPNWWGWTIRSLWILGVFVNFMILGLLITRPLRTFTMAKIWWGILSWWFLPMLLEKYNTRLFNSLLRCTKNQMRKIPTKTLPFTISSNRSEKIFKPSIIKPWKKY